MARCWRVTRPVSTSIRKSSGRLALAALIAASWVALIGCESGASGPDAGCAGPVGCNQECELGNSWGVGRYCTTGGGECADTPSRLAPFCTADQAGVVEQFCTRPCADDDQCGEGAVCTSEDGTGPMGCVPDFCFE